MDKVIHWWNVTNHLTKLDGEGVNNCRMYYVQRCKQQSKEVELPKQNFGPSIMCSYCGSLWSKNQSQIRIIPGKTCSKSVNQICKSHSEGNSISRFRATLMKKSLKNKKNKIVIKCSVCLQNTEISCDKPQRPKAINKTECESNVAMSQKKKKKRIKDKTAGLNLSVDSKTPDVTEKKEIVSKDLTPSTVKIKKSKGKEITPIQKVRKMNLAKLNIILNDGKVQKSKNSLNNFLKELY